MFGAKFIESVISHTNVDIFTSFHATSQNRGSDIVRVRIPAIFYSLKKEVKFWAVQNPVSIFV
jgi:hypothetical protein